MKCPKCGSNKVRYVEQRNIEVHIKENRNESQRRRKQNMKHDKLKPRTNFQAVCKGCGWIGII